MNRLKIYCIKFLKNKLEKEEKINNYTFALKNTKITNICWLFKDIHTEF